MKIERELFILVLENGDIEVTGGDLPSLEELGEMVGSDEKPAVEEIVQNHRLCG